MIISDRASRCNAVKKVADGRGVEPPTFRSPPGFESGCLPRSGTIHLVCRLGLEPRTLGLKDPCSAAELPAHLVGGAGFEPARSFLFGVTIRHHQPDSVTRPLSWCKAMGSNHRRGDLQPPALPAELALHGTQGWIRTTAFGRCKLPALPLSYSGTRFGAPGGSRTHNLPVRSRVLIQFSF